MFFQTFNKKFSSFEEKEKDNQGGNKDGKPVGHSKYECP